MNSKKQKDMMVLIGSIIGSMIAGFALGCLKDKMMNTEKCVIDEM